MKFLPTAIPDVVLIEPKVFQDDRGFFLETFQGQKFAAANIGGPFVQDNHSGSRRGILRGLHFQAEHPQGKLVRVLAGEVYDVAADIRPGSATFGRWVGVHLSSANKHQLWVPPGFAHAFYVVSEWAEFAYKVTDYYCPACERSLAWDDPELGIAWPLVGGQPPTLSAKDAAGLRLRDLARDVGRRAA
jgi:dTDP-4-dehydrorhamnose 3,5-epimerase